MHFWVPLSRSGKTGKGICPGPGNLPSVETDRDSGVDGWVF